MVTEMADPAAFITAHLPLKQVPGRPDLALHTAVPQSGVWRLSDDGAPPYWAWPWAGGLALAQHLGAHPKSVAGRTVIDLGTGSGLVAIAAARAGAARVTAIDCDPLATVAARLNAAHNGVVLDIVCADPLDGPPAKADLVLVGDLFYETALASRVTAYLDRYLALGTTILVGDIGRAALPGARLETLSVWPVPDFGDGASAPARSAHVFAYRPHSG